MNDTPTPPRKPRSDTAPASKEARLAEALRANLRRRKAPRAASDVEIPAQPASEKPEDAS